MNIEQALEEVEDVFDFMRQHNGYYFRELGELVEDRFEALVYVHEFAKTIKAVHTTHDSKAEMDEWDKFFADIQKVTNG